MKNYFNDFFQWDEKESYYIAEMKQKDKIISDQKSHIVTQKSHIEALEYQLNKLKPIPESMQSPW